MKIEVDDLRRPAVLALLDEHLRQMHETTPPGHVFAFDAAQLRAPDVQFWTAWDDGAESRTLLGCAALKALSSHAGELKSMRTPERHRGRGAAKALLAHVIGVARTRGYREVFLETGRQPAFAPARTLYRNAGFQVCGPFGDYTDDGNSVFMTLPLRDAPASSQ